MIRRAVPIITLLLCGHVMAENRVDTLQDTSEVQDAVIYSWEECNGEVSGENCRRYNGGKVVNIGVGKSAGIKENRVLFRLPGWNDTLPDSSIFKVYCYTELDTVDRRLFLYPLTRPFFEGSENAYALGDYPDPDSGATWLHAYLDDGDTDSVLWTEAGGDYVTSVACTTTITGTGQYFAFTGFDRILNYWDTSGACGGFILINENASPSSSSLKVIKSSESGSGYAPLALLYYSDRSPLRRGRVARLLSENPK